MLLVVLSFLFAGCTDSQVKKDESQPVRYLGVGNSFTWDSTKFLGEIAASEGRDLEAFVAGIGGSSLETHVEKMRRYEEDPNDPEGKPYRRQVNGEEARYSLKEVLQQEPWDYVSIQQLSKLSFQPATYEPFAGELISYIREYAPQAEIVVHMTWAYREDHDWFVSGERSQVEMFDGLTDAYKRLAERYGLQIVPIGAAVQAARSMEEWSYSFPDPEFDYESAASPDVPAQPGSLNAGWYWRTDEETREQSLRLDATHMNDAGRYLGGLVHFQFLFGEPASPDVFRPEGISEREAESFREAARQAIGEYDSFNNRIMSFAD